MVARIFDVLLHALLVFALLFFAVLYGVWAATQNRFPAPQLRHAWDVVQGIAFNDVRNQMLSLPGRSTVVEGPDSERLADGLVMVVGITDGPVNFVRVIDREGSVVHEWQPDWFETWPEDDWLPVERRPVSQPGAEIHGAAIAPNGDLIANFEHLSTVRLNPCGKTVWKLPNLGHHSVHVNEDGTIWVGAEQYFASGDTGYTGHRAPLESWTLQHLSANGEILTTIPVIEILEKNDLLGLLYLSSIERHPTVTGDTLHLNDVEAYPGNFSSEIFEAGDLLVSLRNINTILVVDPETLEVKFRSTGRFLRQHDPDFVGGDEILVFDNRNHPVSTETGAPRSRVLRVNASDGSVLPLFPDGAQPYIFTSVLGKHQALPNGNHLVTSSMQGSAIEFDSDGRQVWRFNNRVTEGHNGLLVEATVLPREMDRAFFETLQRSCASTTSAISQTRSH